MRRISVILCCMLKQIVDSRELCVTNYAPCSPVSVNAIMALGASARLAGLESLQLVDCDLDVEACEVLAQLLMGMWF